MIAGSDILVTGGAGSVGRQLISALLIREAETVRILDNHEPNLSEVQTRFGDERCRYLVGDIRDEDRLQRAVEGIDVVVHAAAMKHVDLSEYNPFEAVKTNVVGLQNVVDAAIDSEVKRVVFTSSDKSVNPMNTMGATKLLGENLVTAGNKYPGRPDIRFASVRFGNVLNSSQSVIPVFAEQIQEGGPVTITDPDMTRFFLAFKDVVNLVTTAIEQTNGGEIFISKMAAVKIPDLAKAMIDLLAPEFSRDPTAIETKITGRRPGETFHEEIMTEREAKRALENESVYAIPPKGSENGGYLDHDGISGFSSVEDITRCSKNADLLSVDEIKQLFKTRGLVEDLT